MKRIIKTKEENTTKKAKLFLSPDKKEALKTRDTKDSGINCYLDDLARLFQDSTYGRVATCLIDQTIVIADDKIYAGLSAPKIELIRTVMKYFSDFANEHPGYKNSREEVFKQLCVVKLYGYEKDSIRLDNQIIATISKDILSVCAIESQPRILHLTQQVLSYDVNLQPAVLETYKISASVAREFLIIEKFIETNRTSDQNDLVIAFKGKENQAIFIDHTGGILKDCQGLVQYGGQASGYIMLDIDAAGVHPKAKIIEYLVYTGIIQDIVTGDKIYIGTSQLCCKMCNDLAKAVNEIFCSGEEIIQIIKTYGIHFDWIRPMIYEDNSNDRNTSAYFLHLVNPEQINKLNKSVPELRQISEVFAKSSMNTLAPNTQYEKVEKLMLKIKEAPWDFGNKKAEDNRLTLEKLTSIDTPWYDYLAIKDGLIKKGAQADNVLNPAQSEEELEVILNQINIPNHAYIIPLNVNAIDGSFSATNHWVGLYVTTDEAASIDAIKYINPIGQPINQQLVLKLLIQTGVYTKDLTEGKGVQFAFCSNEFGIAKLEGNDYDCGPMLVQLFYELTTYRKILSHSFGEQKSIEFGQKCRNEQRCDEGNELNEGAFLINSAVTAQNLKIEQNVVVLPIAELELAGESSTVNFDNEVVL